MAVKLDRMVIDHPQWLGPFLLWRLLDVADGQFLWVTPQIHQPEYSN